MTDPLRFTRHPPLSSDVAQHVRPVGFARLTAWLLMSGAGIVFWLQYPSGPWEFGVPLLSVSSIFLVSQGSWRKSIPPRTAFLSVSALLLLVLGPIAAYLIFGSSGPHHEHPRLLLAFKISGALIWVATAIRVSQLVLAARRNSPAV